jgi:copper(I)-binding protein
MPARNSVWRATYPLQKRSKTLKRILLAAFIAVFATPTLAEIQIRNGYARSGMPGASSGAAFMTLVNTGPFDDRLIGVTTEAARKIELHSNVVVDGIAQMRPITEGIFLPTGALTVLARGGDHIMLMGLVTPLVQDQFVRITLIFEQAGEMTIDVPVDYLAIDPIGSNGALVEPEPEPEVEPEVVDPNAPVVEGEVTTDPEAAPVEGVTTN